VKSPDVSLKLKKVSCLQSHSKPEKRMHAGVFKMKQ